MRDHDFLVNMLQRLYGKGRWVYHEDYNRTLFYGQGAHGDCDQAPLDYDTDFSIVVYGDGYPHFYTRFDIKHGRCVNVSAWE